MQFSPAFSFFLVLKPTYQPTWRREYISDSGSIYRPSTTDRSRAEKLWQVSGVIRDVILCDRERDIYRSQKFYATIHSEKMTYLTIVLFCKRQFPAAVCFRDEQ
jgi:hypothetical protein